MTLYVNTGNKTPEWEIIHWPVKCRGNFIRLVFAECGVPFKETSGWDICASLIQSPYYSTQPLHSSLHNVSMGPPYIRKIGDALNKTMINQCVIATQYLSELYGLRPKSDLSHAQCGMIVANCNDAFTGIYRTARQLELKKITCDEFVNEYFLKRFGSWLEILEQPLKKEINQKYFFEDRITQSDLAVYNVMEGFKEWLGHTLFTKYVLNKHQLLSKHFELIKNTSKGVQHLTKIQNEMGFTWWPYESRGGIGGYCPYNDALYIRRSREVLLKSKL